MTCLIAWIRSRLVTISSISEHVEMYDMSNSLDM